MSGILVTSRAPLRISYERVYRVSGLAVPAPDQDDDVDELRRHAAIALFIDRVTTANPTFELTPRNGGAVAELCRYFGGLPLALELAARAGRPLARQHPRAPAHLTGAAGTGAPRRARAPSDDASDRPSTFGSRSDGASAVRPLGHVRGGRTAGAAETVCADLEQDTVDGLSTLVEHGLIYHTRGRHDTRFTMLEPVRDYAQECLRRDPRGEEAALRQAQYFAAFAEAAEAGLQSSDQLGWLERLNDEQTNLRAILQHASGQPQLDLALRIAGALIDYWFMRDLQAELREWLVWALDQPRGDASIRARGLLALGTAACEIDEYREATPALQECLRICADQKDWRLMAHCEAQLAWAAYQRGEPARSGTTKRTSASACGRVLEAAGICR